MHTLLSKMPRIGPAFAAIERIVPPREKTLPDGFILFWIRQRLQVYPNIPDTPGDCDNDQAVVVLRVLL